MEPEPGPARSTPVANLLLLACGLLAAAGLGEIALRAGGFRYVPLGIHAGFDNGSGLPFALHHEAFVFDPATAWTPRPGHGVFDEHGLRVSTPIASAPGPEAVRVLALGDSNTLGWLRPGGANWPEYLDELLPDAYQVVNAGVWGFSAVQGRARLEQLAWLRPHVVLISFGANDAHRVRVADRQYLGRLARLGPLANLRLGQVVLRFLDAWLVDLRTGPLRLAPDEYREVVASLVRRAAELGATPVLMTRPWSDIGLEDTWIDRAAEYNTVLLEVARAHGTALVDVEERFRGRPEMFTDDSHLHEAGHRELAEMVEDELVAQGLARRPARRLDVRPCRIPARLEGFWGSVRCPAWTRARARLDLAGLGFYVPADATRLVVETHGWRSLALLADGAAEVMLDGELLAPAGSDDQALVFALPRREGTHAVSELTLRVPTFRAPVRRGELRDRRRLGLDIRRVSVR